MTDLLWLHHPDRSPQLSVPSQLDILKKFYKYKKSKYSSLTINDALVSSSEPATSTSIINTNTAVIQVMGITATHESQVPTSVSASTVAPPTWDSWNRHKIPH
ncbi:hypothetical protein BYT27DRAFT_7250481 [Phlegmacium glaucopus]|nr:hypothetical protein BYT27DRAFT_7250481 [Phlegmacium glaucopus]